MYHKIEPRQEIGINTLSPARFARHLDYLAGNGFETVTVADILEARPRPRPARPVIITFDDAYASVAEHAFPLMKERGMRGVVYVVTAYIGRWNDWDATLGGIRFRHMDADQLAMLHDAGWELGVHGRTHRSLPTLSAAELVEETAGARHDLAGITGEAPLSFAFPFGQCDPAVELAVASAGFAVACGGIDRGDYGAERRCLERIPVYQFEGTGALARKLRPGGLPLLSRWKVRLLSWPAALTPRYQRWRTRQLPLED